MSSSAYENKPSLDKCAGYASEELLPSEESVIYSFEEPVRRVPQVVCSPPL